MNLPRILFLGVFLMTFNSAYCQLGKGGRKGEGCRICIGSKVYANYIFKTQIDAGLEYLVYTIGYKSGRGMRSIGKPRAVYRLFFRLGAEYNFRYPIIAVKVGLGYQPFKNLYTLRPNLYYDGTNKLSNFFLKTLGSLKAEFNFIPYIKGDFRSYSLRPEIGLEVPALYRYENKQFVLKPLSVKVNYGYNFYKDKVVPIAMNTHFFSAGITWKLDIAKY